MFEFSCEFRIPAVSGRVDGFMVSDGDQQRIAVHWIEPYMIREAPSFVRYCDLIFTPEAIHYWTVSTNSHRTIHFGDGVGCPEQARPKGTESIIQRTLAIVERLAVQDMNAPSPLEVVQFFLRSRGLSEYAHASALFEVDESESDPAESDTHRLNMSPSGTRYSKETRPDGTLIWCADRAASNQSIATITIKPLMGVSGGEGPFVFDPASLGRWALISEPYRTYWTFDQAYCALAESADSRAASRALCDKIESYINTGTMPGEVLQALRRLRFKTSLMTDDNDRVWLSAQDMVAGLCRNRGELGFQHLFELGSMSGDIQKRYHQGMKENLRPLVSTMVDSIGDAMPDHLDRIAATIARNGWFVFGDLLVQEVRDRRLVDQRALDSFSTRLDASRLARESVSVDPREMSESVKHYLSIAEGAPPEGPIEANDIRGVLNRGLTGLFAENDAARHELVENVVRSLSLIAGEGPFNGDGERLVASVHRFSRHYLIGNRPIESIDSVLATFLALSFYDVSTPSDHEALLSQFRQNSDSLQYRVNAMLTTRALNSLVTPEDVRRTFQLYERIVQRYIEDPFWPIYKFPLTRSEESRLAGKLRLSLIELEPFLDGMSLKIKYGGISEDLKTAIIEEISRTAQSVLPYSAFLRIPPRMGISCQYYCGYGFSIGMQGSLYLTDDHPRELFRQMRYFHLGHRFQSIAEHKQELTQATRIEEFNQ
ncbi:MAG TPA: hypothetical protein VIN62_04000 [Candidatus Cryosericum sp.]